MFDDFGGLNDFNSGFDDFSMNDLYYQQDTMQQELFQQQQDQFQQQQFETMRQQQDEFQQQVTVEQNQSLFRKVIDFIAVFAVSIHSCITFFTFSNASLGVLPSAIQPGKSGTVTI